MMKTCRWEFDQNYRQKYGTSFLAGTDEAGRGAMAGPLVVASVILPIDYDHPQIRDSKKLSPKLREHLYWEILDVAISYVIIILDVPIIEKLNPKQASIAGMKKSSQGLIPSPAILLVDGEKITDLAYPCFQIIKGDDLSLTIGAASILAKVTRDQIMTKLSLLYPDYLWEQNKGYCTLEHQSRLVKYGLTEWHRKTYAPVKRLLKLEK